MQQNGSEAASPANVTENRKQCDLLSTATEVNSVDVDLLIADLNAMKRLTEMLITIAERR